jgi:glucose-1-phosphate cytidylyltransferase
LTTVPLRSQYGLVQFSADGRVQSFMEKPVLRDRLINAGFFTLEKTAFDHWAGHNLERDVLPEIGRGGQLYAYRHDGFWKSMDTSKDQEELERLCVAGAAPWIRTKTAAASVA